MIDCLAVKPGFGGSKFDKRVLPKLANLRKAFPALDIMVDGGIDEDTATLSVQYGANILTAGSFVFSNRKMSVTGSDSTVITLEANMRKLGATFRRYGEMLHEMK